MSEKPPVKSYCGGIANYCTPVDPALPKREWVDCTDEQLMEEVRRRGFVIRDAQIGREWVGLTRRELDIATLGLEDLGDCYLAIEAKLREKNT